MKPTVSVEASVTSYLMARMSRDLIVAAHRQITHEWCENARPQFDCFVSPVVLDEISGGDPDAAVSRFEAIASFSILAVTREVENLAILYFSAIVLPDKARADSYHLAIASAHGMDYLVSWNCSHIVSGRVRRVVDEINTGQGIRTPVLCTPEELMEV